MRQMMEKKWKYNGTVQHLFIDYEKAHDLLRRDLLYNTVTEFCVPVTSGRLIKTYLDGSYNEVRIGKNLPDAFTIQDDLKQDHALSPLFFNFVLNGTHQLLVYDDDDDDDEVIN
jgi:hypothetical protein